MNVMKERRLRGAIPTQLEVAKAVGVKPSAVSKWERGLAKPTSCRSSPSSMAAPSRNCLPMTWMRSKTSESRIGSSSLYCDRTCEYGKGQFA